MPPKPPKKCTHRALSKTSAAYWQSKVFLEKKGGWSSSTYFVRIQARGERRKVRLESTIKEDAGREALAFYLKVISQGWPAEASEKNKDYTDSSEEAPVGPVTVSWWISATSPLLAARTSTAEKYAESLRTLAAGLLGVPRFRGATSKALVDQMPLSVLTSEKIQDWIDSRMRLAREKGLTATTRSGNTVRAVLRNARGLFSESLRKAVEAAEGIAAEDPFADVRAPKKVIVKYTSRFDAESLLAQANKELRTPPAENDSAERISQFEQWKIIYLGLVAGLRYNEIDKLRSRDISCKAGRISIRAHDQFQPKAAASEGDVLVSNDAAEVIKEMLQHTKGEWFLLEARSSRNKNYRSGLHHDRAVAWLRRYEENGFRPFRDVPKPIHELRKEAGTLVNQKHGLNETKHFLRHGDIATTAAFYVGTKGQITTGLS